MCFPRAREAAWNRMGKHKMPKKTVYRVRLRRQKTGEEHDRLIIASGKAKAAEHAVAGARLALTTMAERKYAQFEVLSCAPLVSAQEATWNRTGKQDELDRRHRRQAGVTARQDRALRLG